MLGYKVRKLNPIPMITSKHLPGNLLTCFRPRGVLSELATLLGDKEEGELVSLEVKVLLFLKLCNAHFHYISQIFNMALN